MKKEFLDQMYSLREKLISEIARLTKADEGPKPYCKCNCDEISVKLTAVKNQLVSHDEIINSYIKIHA